MNADGSRRWLTPRPFHGRYWRARLVVAWLLIAIFTLIPWLRIGGHPPILLDLATRRFIFLGTVFRPTDTLLLALLMLAIFTAVFLLTAIVGRVWCGWGCPQTVYLEYVYRPVERFFMGRAWGKSGVKVAGWRMVGMYATFVLLSAHLANTFLAYFVGTDQLVGWTLGSPTQHPTAFAVFTVVTGMMLFDFCFFREQLCTLICPYGRFQSALLDRESLVVGYDRKRGEPRGAMRRGASASENGDCIDCTLCVQVCPTGIDIRDGLQMECINCTQCIDACDAVMTKIGKPTGLIRYSSQRRLEGTPAPRLRARLVVYPTLFIGFVTAFIVLLTMRTDAAIVQMRTPGVAFMVRDDGRVTSPVRLRVDNRLDTSRRFVIASTDPGVELEGDLAFEIQGNDSAELQLRATAPRTGFDRGHRQLELRAVDESGRAVSGTARLIGPLDVKPLGGGA